MVDASLLEYERDVEQSRARLTRDLAVLCSPETFASFTDDLKQERDQRCALGGRQGARGCKSGRGYCDRRRTGLAAPPAAANCDRIDRSRGLQPMEHRAETTR
jgi:hypothetical protein